MRAPGHRGRPHGRYLSADSKGKLRADAETRGQEEQWTVISHPDGRWTLQSAYGYYLGGTGSNLHAFAREIGETEKWALHLAVHPLYARPRAAGCAAPDARPAHAAYDPARCGGSVCIRNVNRRAYARLAGDEINVDSLIPWDGEAIFFLGISANRYSIRAANGKYLKNDGVLAESCDDSSLFIVEMHDNKIAFKTPQGKYLQGQGTKGRVSERRVQVGPDELFEISTPPLALSFKMHNGRFMSTAQTTEVKADQETPGPSETFQVVYKDDTTCAIRGKNGAYWTVSGNGGIHATATSVGANELFTIDWAPGTCAIRASNGKYLNTKMNGQISATVEKADDKCGIQYQLLNRTQLILQCEYGCVAVRNHKLVCHAVEPDTLHVTPKGGKYTITTAGGKPIVSGGEDGAREGDTAEQFILIPCNGTKCAIQAANGKYLKCDPNGTIVAASTGIGPDELWEY